MEPDLIDLDVLCVGHASYDLVFSVPHHPAADEKTVADALLGCGGGPAANAAVVVAKLGYRVGFSGYLGNDVYGDSHLSELLSHGVDTCCIVRGDSPTPLSAVLVKPDGKRALINYKGDTRALPADSVDFGVIRPKVVLCDGHEPHISARLLERCAAEKIPTVLDAGSLHSGTEALLDKMDYLVCSEKFALQHSGGIDAALSGLAEIAPWVVVTLGERGLVWRAGQEAGRLAAPPVTAIDTTGAGDAFHGAFAAGLAAGLAWPELLRYASAAGALCCTRLGARPGLPDKAAHRALLQRWQSEPTP
ncbi:carbohydrate kinase family protein [Methylomonas sp. HW2-6]|uniref:carbohydrate kinase family protein n=1 Tax=Methylomonas sp. HW2-6 TaxID=3376687 RepID=UPI0040415C3F